MTRNMTVEERLQYVDEIEWSSDMVIDLVKQLAIDYRDLRDENRELKKDLHVANEQIKSLIREMDTLEAEQDDLETAPDSVL